MAYEYVNSFLLLLHPHFLLKNGGEAVFIYYSSFKLDYFEASIDWILFNSSTISVLPFIIST